MLIVVDSEEDLGIVAPLIAALKALNKRVGYVFVTEDNALLPSVRAIADEEDVVSRAPLLPFAKTILMKRAAANLVLVCGLRSSTSRAVAERAGRFNAFAVVLWKPSGDGGAKAELPRADLFIPLDECARAELIDRGIPGKRLAKSQELSEPQRLVSERLVGFLVAKRTDVSRSRPVQAVREQLLRWVTDPQSSAHLFGWRYRQIASFEALAALLGRPQTILCLGNGPSSEDPALQDLAYDSLFRVNHRWLERGNLTEPDLVFTGGIATIRAIGGDAVFGFQTAEDAKRLTLKSITSRRKLTYFHAEGLNAIAFGRFEPDQPSNGAVMLAVALALRPKKLIIAGIDFFENPAGAYPGGNRSVNAYTSGHDADKEKAFITESLSIYDGELVLIGDKLKAAVEAQARRLQPVVAAEQQR